MSTTPSRYAQAMADPNRPMCPNGCQRRIWAGGVCAVCYRMTRLYGVAKTGWRDAAEILRRRTEFFWANVDKRGPDECWPWLRKPNDAGYGQLRWIGTSMQAHRVAYLLEHGELPGGMEIDHTCHDPRECTLKRECPHRLCCNPAHLEAVTRPVNLERSNRNRPGNGTTQARRKCEPGCTCHRHKGTYFAGGKACPPGCTCKKHEVRKCPPDCTCGHHGLRKETCPKCGGPRVRQKDGTTVCIPCRRVAQRDRNRRTGRVSGKGPGSRQREQTHCINGHEFTPENTRLDKDGYRICRECSRDSKRRMRLNSPGGGKPCPPDCTCGRHRPRR
jgi:hypothetical protein